MKHLFLLMLLPVFLTSCISRTESTESVSETPTANEMTDKLRHIVLFKFKESSSPADIQEIEEAFASLPSQIEEIKDFEWGLNNSPEGLNKGFTHSFMVTFDSEDGRSVYLPHPAHQAFVDLLGPHLDDVLVVDYWAN
ncbi:MAG TPA: Dabb family protein [Balneolaceae bacterium]|nr:Dabb family protein [Balneolaceae bacterium]